MKCNLELLYKNSEDILNASSIIYDICNNANEETAKKILPIIELIRTKADKMCIQIAEPKEE